MKRFELVGIRKNLKMTQENVAKKAGIQRSYYGLIENGIRNPTLGIATSIASALDTTIQTAFPNEIFFGNKCYVEKQ